MMGTAGNANADPDAVAKALAELETIQQEASYLDLEIIEASMSAEESQTKLEQVNQDLAQQVELVDGMSADLGAIAVLQLQSGGFGLTTQLLTSDSEGSFLSSLATIQNEADRSNAEVQELQLGQARVEELRREAERTNAAIQEDLRIKQERAADYEAKEAEAEAVYERLNAEEQERLRQVEIERQRQQDEADRLAREAAEREAATAAQSQAAEPSSSASPSSSTSSTKSSEASSSAPVASGDASSRALQAVSIAKAQVGKRYVWGTSGPSTFDCSGLTSYAYRQVGLDITRSSRGQASLGVRVAKSDLRPGDLVFYYSPISHVGMYIGNGQIVDAANPRAGVRITSLNSMPFTTARRVL